MHEPPPILTAELFPEISRHLIELLRSLSAEDWNRSTVSSQRTVKDIASHLLDGSLRRLSIQRDGFFSPDSNSQPLSNETLMDFLNRLNKDWELGTRRLSPRVLIDLIAWADKQLAELFRSLDPDGPAIFAVAWAGESQSENWMDIAREYTEKWHHTQQIFEATDRPSTIMTRDLAHPCFDIFMRALPFTYSSVEAPTGTVVGVNLTGEAGGWWFVIRLQEGWSMTADSGSPSAVVTMDQDTFWKLVTKRRGRTRTREQFPEIEISGDQTLGQHVLDMLSVMA